MNHASAIGLVALGSALGGVGRYLLGVAAHSSGLTSRAGTLCANGMGCFAAGVLLGSVLRTRGADDPWRLLLITGVMGGLTTFSAFSIESVELFRQQRMGWCVAYIGATVALGLVGVVLGAGLGRAIG